MFSASVIISAATDVRTIFVYRIIFKCETIVNRIFSLWVSSVQSTLHKLFYRLGYSRLFPMTMKHPFYSEGKTSPDI